MRCANELVTLLRIRRVLSVLQWLAARLRRNMSREPDLTSAEKGWWEGSDSK
jgi:hypothetical protein